METNLLWSKKRDITHGGVQLTSFGPKTWLLLTGGSNWPFRCLDYLVFLILSYSASNLALMQNHSADLQLVCNFFNKVLIFFILLVFSLQSGFDAESFCRFTTCVHSVQLLELWKKQARHLARRMCKTRCASRACLDFPSNSLLACFYAKLY